MRMIRTVALFALVLAMVCGMASAEETVSLIVDSRTTQAFTNDEIPEVDLNAILEAGLAATSAINQQPWFFAVVMNQEVIEAIKGAAGGFGGGAPAGGKPKGSMPEGAMPEGGMPAAPKGGMPSGGAKAGLGDSHVAIIVYKDGATASPNADFDCGLACENMFIAAKALGYGAKIVSSPTMQLNGDDHDALCEKLGVNTSYTAVAVLLIGTEDAAVDGATGASVRSGIDEKVSIVR